MTSGVLAEQLHIEMPVFGVDKYIALPIASLGHVMSHSRNRNTSSTHEFRNHRFEGCEALKGGANEL
jgi:hypothetical protein